MVPTKILLLSVVLLCVHQGVCDDGTTSEEEELLKWTPPEDSRDKYPYYLSGYDHEGSPVYIVEMGKWDLRSAVEAGPEAMAVVDKIFTQMMVRGTKHGNEAPGSPGILVIIDYEGYTARQATHVGAITFLLKQVTKLEKFLRTPGVKKAIGVNYNFLVLRLYDIAKPLLGGTADIFEIYGTNAEKWKPVLLKQIDPDQLPEWYGGSKDHKPLKIFP